MSLNHIVTHLSVVSMEPHLVIQEPNFIWRNLETKDSKMLILTPEHLREVCRREEAGRKKKVERLREKKVRRDKRLEELELVKNLEAEKRKMERLERKNLLQLWMENERTKNHNHDCGGAYCIKFPKIMPVCKKSATVSPLCLPSLKIK